MLGFSILFLCFGLGGCLRDIEGTDDMIHFLA